MNNRQASDIYYVGEFKKMKINKSHKWFLCGFTIGNAIKVMAEFVLQENLRSWLLDPDCNDQYSVIHAGGEKVSILLNSPAEPAVVKERSVSIRCYFSCSISSSMWFLLLSFFLRTFFLPLSLVCHNSLFLVTSPLIAILCL